MFAHIPADSISGNVESCCKGGSAFSVESYGTECLYQHLTIVVLQAPAGESLNLGAVRDEWHGGAFRTEWSSTCTRLTPSLVGRLVS